MSAFSVIVTVAIVFAVEALYFSYANTEIQRKVVEAPTADANSKLAEQDAKLTRYSWVSREKGTVTIPIDRAMTLVTEEVAATQQLDPTQADPSHGGGS